MATVEERLRAAAQDGTAAIFGPDETVEADLIRRILLSLPRRAGPAAAPAALRIEGKIVDGIMAAGPTINGRIELNDVAIPGDGAIAPVALTNCVLNGGFTGARSRFGSLRFKDCRFQYPRADNVPTIDLGGARFECGLYMVGLAPLGAEDYLWIRAPGMRIAGALDLSRSRLRAPPDHKEERLYCEPSIACLDLTKATVAGDVYALNGLRCDGCFHARGVHVRGNVWLGGATIEAPGSKALMLQRAIIEGSLMLNAPAERADGSGAVPAFTCAGDLNLRAARIGGDVDLRSAFIAGTADFLDLEVRSDLIFNAAVRDEINLAGCRIGGSVSLSNLLVGRSFKRLDMRSGTIGRALVRRTHSRDPVLVAARLGALRSIRDADLVETLWKERDDTDLFQVAFVRVGGELCLLDGFATGLQGALEKAGYDLDTDEQASEFLRLHGIYAHGEAGSPVVDTRAAARALATVAGSDAANAVEALPDDFFRIAVRACGAAWTVTAAVVHGDRFSRCEFTLSPASASIRIAKKHLLDGPLIDHVPAIHGAFLRHPSADPDDLRGAIMRGEWPIVPAVPGMASCRPGEVRALQAKLLPRVLAAFDLHGDIDFSSLSCDMLDDRGGDGWGPGAHFDLNHFVYRHADWRLEHGGTASQTIIRNRLMAKWVEWFGLRRPNSKAARVEDHWKDWQARRNWLFQQFYRVSDKEDDPGDDPPEYPTKRIFSARKIKERHYRPQPFEQVIRVARAEGRENVAGHFEVLKRAIEGRHFNRDVRWWLAIPAIIFAAAWLALKGGTILSAVSTLVALWFTILAMIWGSAIQDRVFRVLGRMRPSRNRHVDNRRVAKWTRRLLYFTPSLVLFLVLGWFETPFHFLVALCIFASIRLVTVIANNTFWLCFGYLRRPVRAIVTLIVAFLVGWFGVHVANRYEMLVVSAEPVAPLAAAAGAPRVRDPAQTPQMVMGSLRVGPDDATFAHEIPCLPVVSEPLYALDVLIPIVDLGEERRCEVRRLFNSDLDTPWPFPGRLGVGDLVANIPRITIENRRFWWWMKALYAIAGWFIVSLSILTFAQATRTHAEPPTQHK
jgi:hypothetical protein